MKNTLIALLAGILVGAGGVWFLNADDSEMSPQEARELAREEMRDADNALEEAGKEAKQGWNATLEALQLRAEDIQEELAEDSQVIRRKARDFGEATVDAAVDTRITGTIKAKLAASDKLSMFDISVSTTQGHVTLSGTVDSPEQIGEAMALALETVDVREVVSNIRVE